jgi:D-glycero-D-manno-heptose 1,7-bisphosphate phosphatase
MRPFTDTQPKHLYPVAGRPFVEWLMEQLAEQGFTQVLFLLGYLAAATRAALGDGRRFGVRIDYEVTPAHWESAGRLAAALPQLDESFLLCYCDNYWPFSARRLFAHWQASGCRAQLAVYENADGWTRSNVAHRDGRIVRYDARRAEPGLAGVDIGYAMLNRSTIDAAADPLAPFGEWTYPALAARGELAAYVTAHRYYGIGGPERLAATDDFFGRHPAVLVDRDGVLNRRPALGDYVKSWDEWTWMPGVLEALARFHRAGYRVLVITNQAGVARGSFTAEALEQIHGCMRQDVERAGGRIDAIYACTHHWDAGCECRKPRPGLLFAAQREFHLDLSRTFFLGDDERDAAAAEAAGCLFGEVSERTPLSSYADAWLAAAALAAPGKENY